MDAHAARHAQHFEQMDIETDKVDANKERMNSELRKILKVSVGR